MIAEELRQREILKIFECPICLEVFETPVSLDCCGRTFCMNCIEESLKKHKACALCHTAFPANYKLRENVVIAGTIEILGPQLSYY